MIPSRHLIVVFVCMLLAMDSRAQSGTCPTGEAEAYLQVNNVRARILNTGNLFWRGNPNVYEVPRGSGLNVIFATGFWMGGQVDGELRFAGSTYGPYEFWPGPDRNLSQSMDCAARDRMYEVTSADLRALDAGESPTRDVREWPWQWGAPVVDGDGNAFNYDLEGGDRPEVLGDQSIYWIMHDAGGEHGRFDSEPLGVEVHVTAFAASHPGNPSLDNTTYYRYRIVNRNIHPIKDAYLGYFMDPDLGAAFDDYVGSDSTLHMMYAYNADNDDQGYYGEAPPAVGFQAMSRPLADSDGLDNDEDGQVDEPGEMMEMSAFVFYPGGGGVMGSPGYAQDAYNYLQGRWKDGQSVTYGGNGRDFSAEPFSYMYPAMPPAFWSEVDVDSTGVSNPPSDRSGVMGIGPFNLDPGEDTELVMAVITAFGDNNLDSVVRLKETAAELLDRSAQSIPVRPDSGKEPEVPSILAPGRGASNQPTDLRISWTEAEESFGYILQVDTHPSFTDPMEKVSWDTSENLDLAPSQEYYARVRSRSVGGYSHWSDVHSFQVGSLIQSSRPPLEGMYVVANAAGILPVPQAASADWLDFPNAYERPNDQQQVGEGIWMIATDPNAPCIDDRCRTVSAFLERTFGSQPEAAEYDWEIRFEHESQHAMGWRLGNFPDLRSIPFSVWRIGKDTPDDPSDDVRFLVGWKDLYGGTGEFRLNPIDHPTSGGSNDPYTDGIFVFAPDDLSPGSSGYEAWLSDAANGVFPGFDENKAWLRNLVFFNWNGGDVSDGRMDEVQQLMPEPGTVFRIDLVDAQPPILSAPGPNLTVDGDSVSFAWWTWSEQARLLEIDDNASFSSPEWSVQFPFPLEVRIPTPPQGIWHWRVTDWMGARSDVGQFFVGTAVNVDRAEIPASLSLLNAYPNPFPGELNIGFSTAEAGPITIDVFDILGRHVATLLDGHMLSGEHDLSLDLSDQVSGAYLLRLSASGQQQSKVIYLVR